MESSIANQHSVQPDNKALLPLAMARAILSILPIHVSRMSQDGKVRIGMGMDGPATIKVAADTETPFLITHQALLDLETAISREPHLHNYQNSIISFRWKSGSCSMIMGTGQTISAHLDDPEGVPPFQSYLEVFVPTAPPGTPPPTDAVSNSLIADDVGWMTYDWSCIAPDQVGLKRRWSTLVIPPQAQHPNKLILRIRSSTGLPIIPRLDKVDINAFEQHLNRLPWWQRGLTIARSFQPTLSPGGLWVHSEALIGPWMSTRKTTGSIVVTLCPSDASMHSLIPLIHDALDAITVYQNNTKDPAATAWRNSLYCDALAKAISYTSSNVAPNIEPPKVADLSERLHSILLRGAPPSPANTRGDRKLK